MFSQPQYLTFRNGHPYFIVRVPTDLLPQINRKIIKKSLKTTDKQQALIIAGGLQQKYLLSFSLLRSGALTTDQAESLLNELTSKARRKPVLLLSGLYKLYAAERSPSWAERSVEAIGKEFARLVQVIGDLPVNSLDRTAMIAGRDKMLDTLAVGTVNKHLTLLSSVLKWGIKHDYVSRNPAEGLQLKTQKRADEERKAYDLEDIKRIIRHLPSKDAREPFKYWIPMIGMYSGMRREEICQLIASDFREIEGIPCIEICDSDGRKLKTKASARLVPIHPKLIEAGLLDFAKQSPQQGNLWGFKQWRGVWGVKFGNWWSADFNRQHVTNDPLKCFHSLRHTFAYTLKQLGVQETLIAELMGHANDSITTRYSKRYQPKVLLGAISLLEYDNLRSRKIRPEDLR